MKFAVSAYSFSQYIRQGKMTQFDSVAKAKEMGFDGIEFTEINGEDLNAQKENARKIRKEADRVGIEVVAYSIGASLYKETQEEMDAEVERLKSELDIAKILGVKLMRHDVCYKLGKKGNARSFDLMLPTIAENARKVTEYGESLGIKTCSENHGFIAQDSDRMERLFNAVNHENYGLLVDMGNFLCADEDPAIAVSRVAPYAIYVHAKDMLARKECDGAKTWFQSRGCTYLRGVTIGEGDVPVKKCIQILKKAGYDDYISIEFEGVEDCINGIARGFENLKTMVNSLK